MPSDNSKVVKWNSHDDIPMKNSINPCYKCKFCSQDTYIAARMHGLCTRPKDDGRQSNKSAFSYDRRQDETACGLEGKWFVDRNIPDEIFEAKNYKRTTGPRHHGSYTESNEQRKKRSRSYV